jgi:hypothetical protein
MPTTKDFIAADALAHSFTFNQSQEFPAISLVCREFNKIISGSDYYWRTKITAHISTDLPRITRGFDNAQQAFIFHRNKLAILTMDIQDKQDYFATLTQALAARPHYQQGLLRIALQKFELYLTDTNDVWQLLTIFPNHWQAIISELAQSPKLSILLTKPTDLYDLVLRVATRTHTDPASYVANFALTSNILLPRVLNTNDFDAIYECSYSFLKLLPLLNANNETLFVAKILSSQNLINSFLTNTYDHKRLLEKLSDDSQQNLSPNNLESQLAFFETGVASCPSLGF